MKAADEPSSFTSGVNNFFQKIYFCDISLKNTLVHLYSVCKMKIMNQDHEISKVSCLKQGSKMSNVCPKQGQKVLKALAGHLYSNFP